MARKQLSLTKFQTFPQLQPIFFLQFIIAGYIVSTRKIVELISIRKEAFITDQKALDLLLFYQLSEKFLRERRYSIWVSIVTSKIFFLTNSFEHETQYAVIWATSSISRQLDLTSNINYRKRCLDPWYRDRHNPINDRFISSSSINLIKAVEVIEKYSVNLCRYNRRWGIKINEKKSQVCTIRRKSRYFTLKFIHKEANSLKIKVGNTIVSRSKSIKYLEVKLNKFLDFKCGTLSSIRYILCKKVSFNTKTKIIVFMADLSLDQLYATERLRRSHIKRSYGKLQGIWTRSFRILQ